MDFAPSGGDAFVAENCCSERDELQQEISQQQRQIESLSEELATVRCFEAAGDRRVVTVAEITLGRYTRGNDIDADGIDDGLIVYLVPRDEQGDVVKAYGEVDIELFDLAADASSQQLGAWQFSIDEVAGHWLGGFGTNHYKFELDWPEGREPSHDALTLVVSWRDTLTGRNLDTQAVVNVVSAAGSDN